MSKANAIALGMALGLLGGALLLVSFPRVELPCEVTITYKARAIRPARDAKHYKIDTILKQKVMLGTGHFAASSLVCEINLQRTEGI